MSDKKTFADRLNSFIFGTPPPGQNNTPALHSLEQKLDSLLDLQQMQKPERDQESMDDLAAQLRKLAKTQFKSNTLQESQLSQQQESIVELQKSYQKELAELDKQRQQAVESAQLDLLTGLLPALDGLDAAFESGRKQVMRLPMEPKTRRAVIGWLDGIRLSRMRLLDILAAHNIAPIPTLGRPFDPHYHVAVATVAAKGAPNGLIVSEDRRGYAAPDKVLRFAEVVVAQSN